MLIIPHQASRNGVIREMDTHELIDLIESIYEKARNGNGMCLTAEDNLDLRLGHRYYEQLNKTKY